MPTVYAPEDLRSGGGGGGGGGGGDAFERAASSSSSLSLLLLSLALSRSRRRVLKNKGNNKFQWKNSSGKIPVECIPLECYIPVEYIPLECIPLEFFAQQKFQWNSPNALLAVDSSESYLGTYLPTPGMHLRCTSMIY